VDCPDYGEIGAKSGFYEKMGKICRIGGKIRVKKTGKNVQKL